MQLLIVSYTPGSSLLHCIEANRIPQAGEILQVSGIRARVLRAVPLYDVRGCECAVVVDDLMVGAPHMPMTAGARDSAIRPIQS